MPHLASRGLPLGVKRQIIFLMPLKSYARYKETRPGNEEFVIMLEMNDARMLR